MGIKYRQTAIAIGELLKEPFDFLPAMKLCEAVSDWWLRRTFYQRMVADLSAPAREHLREITRRPIDLDVLRALPENTFGHRYAAFFDNGRMSPSAQVDAWPELARVFEEDWVMHRFARIHDMHHVLLGFDIDPHGEMGLQIFNLLNFHEPFGALAAASLPITLLKYGDQRRMLREVERGFRLARSSKNLFHVPFEDLFDLDIDDLRRQLHIRLDA